MSKVKAVKPIVAITFGILYLTNAVAGECNINIKSTLTSFDKLTAYVTEQTKCGAVKVKDLCMVFDIDNTLLTNEPNLGGDSWATWNNALASNDPNKVKNWGYPGTNFHGFEGALRYFMNFHPSEASVVTTVNYFKDTLGHPTIGFTARDFGNYYAATAQQLSYNHLTFANNYIGYPQAGNVSLQALPSGALKGYYQGVYYVADDNKGTTLVDLIREQRKKTRNAKLCSQVVFVDNSQKNVDNVYGELRKANIGIIALHYTGLDQYLTPTPAAISSWQLGKSIDAGGTSQAQNMYNFMQYINK